MMASLQGVKPVTSSYCLKEDEHAARVPFVRSSDYVINSGMSMVDLERERERNRLQRIPSAYLTNSLNNIQVPEVPLTATAIGLPVSGTALRNQLAYLDNGIYAPTLIDGRLFYVSQNDGPIATARNNSYVDLPTEGVSTCHSVPSLIYMSPSGVRIPLEVLERALPSDIFNRVVHAVLREAAAERLALEPRDVYVLSKIAGRSGPSLSTATAYGVGTDGLITGRDVSATHLATGYSPSSDNLRTGAAYRTASVHSARSPSLYTGITPPQSPLYTGVGRSASNVSLGTCMSAPETLVQTGRSDSRLSLRTGMSPITTPVNTGRSASNASLRTGITLPLTPIHTAASRSLSNAELRTGLPLPPTPVQTAADRTLSNCSIRTGLRQPTTPVHTGASRSLSDASLRTGLPLPPTPIHTAASRSVSNNLLKTGISYPPTPIHTAASRSMSNGNLRTGIALPPTPIHTGRPSLSQQSLTASTPMVSLDLNTARGEESLDSLLERGAGSGLKIAPTQPMDGARSPVDPARLVRTPSSADQRAAAAVTSDIRTATQL